MAMRLEGRQVGRGAWPDCVENGKRLTAKEMTGTDRSEVCLRSAQKTDGRTGCQRDIG